MAGQLVAAPAQLHSDLEAQWRTVQSAGDPAIGMHGFSAQDLGLFRRNQASIFNAAYAEPCPATGFRGPGEIDLIHQLMDQLYAWIKVSEEFPKTPLEDVDSLVELKSPEGLNSLYKTFNRDPNFQIGLDQIRIDKTKATVNFTVVENRESQKKPRTQRGNFEIPLDGYTWGKIQWTAQTMGAHRKPPSDPAVTRRKLPSGRAAPQLHNAQQKQCEKGVTVLTPPEIDLFLKLGDWQRGIEDANRELLENVLDPEGIEAIKPLLRKLHGTPRQVFIQEVLPTKSGTRVNFFVFVNRDPEDPVGPEELHGSFEIPRATDGSFWGKIPWNESTVPLSAEPSQSPPAFKPSEREF